jgi:hypothetical protein
LPEQWREACALNADGILDPNLTLAHITHNTAVGLLHQGIAYPSPQWQASPIRLPSASSAETCLAAAIEVAIIAHNYLEDSTSLTNPQFAFCLFISGRMLFAHALHYNIPLPEEFNSLTDSLREISRRWNGPHAQDVSCHRSENLASKFASRLAQVREQGPHALDLRQAAYSEEHTQGQDPASVHLTVLRSHNQPPLSSQPGHPSLNGALPNQSMPHPTSNEGQLLASERMIISDQESSPDSISLAFPPLPLAFQPHSASATQTRMPSPGLINMQQSNLFLGRAGDAGQTSMEGYPDSSIVGFEVTGDGLEYLNPFLAYPILPTQRVSMFSGLNGKDGEDE